jgi:hypothetical protein
MVRAMQVSSAVIPAAGAGTRFLPATKAVPKELMPIGDTPAIQLIIDEALGAGVDHIVIVSSHAKPAIERYFERDDALIAMLREKGNDDAADRLAAIGRDWRVTITYQDDPRGLGHAVGCAREAVGDRPFAVGLREVGRGVAVWGQGGGGGQGCGAPAAAGQRGSRRRRRQGCGRDHHGGGGDYHAQAGAALPAEAQTRRGGHPTGRTRGEIARQGGAALPAETHPHRVLKLAYRTFHPCLES